MSMIAFAMYDSVKMICVFEYHRMLFNGFIISILKIKKSNI